MRNAEVVQPASSVERREARLKFTGRSERLDQRNIAPDAVDPRAIAVMAEIDIDISQSCSASVSGLKLETFEIMTSLGVHKVGVNRGQTALGWDVPEFKSATGRPALPALREIRHGLATRIGALGTILTSAGHV